MVSQMPFLYLAAGPLVSIRGGSTAEEESAPNCVVQIYLSTGMGDTQSHSRSVCIILKKSTIASS